MKNVDNCISFVLHEHGNEEDYDTTQCTVESVLCVAAECEPKTVSITTFTAHINGFVRI